MSLPVYANEIDLLTQSHAIGFQLPVIVNTRNFQHMVPTFHYYRFYGSQGGTQENKTEIISPNREKRYKEPFKVQHVTKIKNFK